MMHVGRLAAVGLSLAAIMPAASQESPEVPAEQVQLSAQAQELLTRSTLRAAAKFQPKPDEFLCYRYVKRGVKASLGVELKGLHAYQASQQLAESPCFRELGNSRKRLDPKDAPRGSVMVWQASSKYPSGHISVSLGDGREVSDRVRWVAPEFGSSVRVFVPLDRCLSGPR